jgi:transcriptional regulator with XRE-family HTH domain
MGLKLKEPAELQELGSLLSVARLERGLSQAELGARCALSQAQISYFEVGQRRPTLDQFLRIAKALEVPIQKLISGSDRPGTELRDIAIELRHLGIADLWVKDVVVPGGFRRAEEVIALAVGGREPEPRIIEAMPVVLAWNEIDPIVLRAYGLTAKPRTARRLAWLADITLAIDRRGGFLGGCRREPLVRLTQIIRTPSSERDVWDSLGRPMAKPPTSPIWRRWKISYDADLDQFDQRARHLDELRRHAGASLPSPGIRRREATIRRKRVGGASDSDGVVSEEELTECGSESRKQSAAGRTASRSRGKSAGGRRDGAR